MIQKKRLIRRLGYLLGGAFLGAAILLLLLTFVCPDVFYMITDWKSSLTAASASSGKKDGAGAVRSSDIEVDIVELSPETQLTSDSGWELTLINREHPLPADYVPSSLVDCGYGCTVDARIADNLQQMLLDAKSQGMELTVVSGYRSYDRQVELFSDGIVERISGGLTPEDAYRETVRSVTLPGASEHEAGIAVDITAASYPVLEESQADTPEQQWLMSHCYEYGFILRYPKGTEAITGITYEPWHYRYVGDAAAKIHSLGITLEEYLEQD
ncbi:MAG TPA: M15 family metallopeptidase [Candidatus Mediterraneibacter merdavium]|nr:M15 family metallopeptidase [Candidatus Mediterraneibacter merdavium]